MVPLDCMQNNANDMRMNEWYRLVQLGALLVKQVVLLG